MLHRGVVRVAAYALPKSGDTGIAWQDVLMSAYTAKYTDVHPKYESSIKSADFLWELKDRNSVFPVAKRI